MELVAGYPYWLIKTGLPYHYPKVLENKKSQVTIIGGGISGALTAYYCMRAGIECILVDARSIGLGSTCASTALLQYELDIPLHKLKSMVGVYKATRSYQLCGEAIDKLLQLMPLIGFRDYSKKQSLFFSEKRTERRMLINEYMAREQAGFDVQLLTSNDLKTAYGLKARSGILSEKGASCNAYLLTHELLQYCMQKGVQVYDHTNIKKIRSYREKIVLETEQGFYIESDYLVNASGYEVVDFIKKKIVNLDCTYAVVSEPMADRTQIWQNDIMMWNTDNPYLYLCPTSERRIILGGRDEPFVNMKTMYRYVDKKAALLAKDFRKRFPYIPFTKELAWSGVFGKTRDSLPYIGNYPAGSRIFYALGFGGNGITFSQVAGEIIADLISGKPNRDAALFSFTR